MLKISKMTGKLEGIDALNTSPLDNEFCKKMSGKKGSICEKCYSRRMLNGIRKNCLPAWKLNGEILSKNYIARKKVPVKTKYFRFNAHGELLNELHLENIWELVNCNPKTNFALWTKRTDLINWYFKNYHKPKNLQLIYSNPKLDNPVNKVPKHFDKVFNVVSKDKTEGININCGAKKCIKCGLCYEDNNTTIINEVLK